MLLLLYHLKESSISVLTICLEIVFAGYTPREVLLLIQDDSLFLEWKQLMTISFLYLVVMKILYVWLPIIHFSNSSYWGTRWNVNSLNLRKGRPTMPNTNRTERRTSGFAMLMFFWCGDGVNKISICGVAVISNLTVRDACVFHAAVFGEMKLFAVLWFLLW